MVNDADVYIRPRASRKPFLRRIYTSQGSLEVKEHRRTCTHSHNHNTPSPSPPPVHTLTHTQSLPPPQPPPPPPPLSTLTHTHTQVFTFLENSDLCFSHSPGARNWVISSSRPGTLCHTSGFSRACTTIFYHHHSSLGI